MDNNPVLVTKLVSWVVSLILGWLATKTPLVPESQMGESLAYILTLTIGGVVGNLVARVKVTPWWKVVDGYWTRDRVAQANTPSRRIMPE